MSYPNQFPQQNNPFGQSPPKSGISWIWITLGVLGAGGALLALVCCGGIASFLQPPQASAAARQPFSVAEVPLPPFPADRQMPVEQGPGVLLRQIQLGSATGGYYATPGHGGYLNFYLPDGQHAPGTVPCILITGAGSTLLAGMGLGDGDKPEHLPYVQAGYAVVAYELDGPEIGEDPEAMRKAFDAFQDSRAGLVNARNALEFVLAKVPEVDPRQIYAAGHSSAATHALLFAAHEPRLAGVIAYAPAADLPAWFGPRLRMMSMLLPGSVDFITQSSPRTHESRIKCPTFLFHAEDDTTCDIKETQAFADRLKQQGTPVELVTVSTGDHYDSMIDEGIPAAIKWLRARK